MIKWILDILCITVKIRVRRNEYVPLALGMIGKVPLFLEWFSFNPF